MRDNGGPGRRRKEAGSLSLRLADLPGGGGWLGHVAIKGEEEARERESGLDSWALHTGHVVQHHRVLTSTRAGLYKMLSPLEWQPGHGLV